MYKFLYISDTVEPRNSGPKRDKKNLMLAYHALISSFIPFKLYIGYNRHCKKLISMIDPLKFVIARF